MSRLEQRFADCARDNRAALVTYICAGDPDFDTSLELLKGLPAAGADIIELGMPFSDPTADGPTIQAAALRALQGGQNQQRTLELVRAFRAQDQSTPLVLMGYANPMVRRGPEWFAQEAAGAGVDGVICVDIPPEEDSALGPALREQGIAPIRLATPTTDDFRLPTVIEGSEGFLYYVSVAGITGKQSAAQDSIDAAVKRLKAATDLPGAGGFGVRTPEQAGAIAKVADGVVVGSALVDLVAEHGADAPAHLRDLTARLAKAVHSAERAAA